MEFKPKFFLSIASIFKNESHILPEWIKYYKKMGVEHFYLVNNNSNDDYQSAIQPHGETITLFHETRSGCQIAAYNETILPIAKQTSKWLLVVDLDEFVYNPKGIPFPKLLKRYNKIPGISAPWIFFGSNQHIKQPKSVINNFTRRMYYGEGKLVNVKNFYQTQYLKCLYPHHAEYIEPFYCTISSKSRTKIINGQDTIFENDLLNDRFTFLTNHYAIQSREFFFNIKTQRGDVHSLKNDNLRNEEYFQQYDHNQIIDLKLCHILTNTKTEGRELLLTINKQQLKHIIIGFPTPDRDRIIQQLINHYNVNTDRQADKVYQIASTYYDEFLIYQENEVLSQIARKFSQAQIWILTDTPKRLLYSYWKTKHKQEEEFKTLYQKETEAVEKAKMTTEATSLIKFGNIEQYIKNAKKFFPKLKVYTTQEFINFHIHQLGET